MLSELYCGLINLACVYFGSSMATDDEHFLLKVDNLVYGKLTNPVPGEGDYVLDSLQIYMEKLNETMEHYIYNRTGQEVVDLLVEQKGPRCITLYLDDHILEAEFKWGTKELGELYYMLSTTKMLWRDFRYFLTTKLGYKIDPLPVFFTTTIGTTTPTNKV